jgi:hypothetical protein
VFGIRRDGELKLFGDDGYGGERGAELVRGGGSKPVELREVLLACQCKLCGSHGIGELP